MAGAWLLPGALEIKRAHAPPQLTGLRTPAPCRPCADKSGTLDFGEWVEWWLQKQRGYAWQPGSGAPPDS